VVPRGCTLLSQRKKELKRRATDVMPGRNRSVIGQEVRGPSESCSCEFHLARVSSVSVT
jgi:hypothetical protein